MDDSRPDPGPDLPAIRASDHEREATAQFLQEAFSEGRLTLAEFDERSTRAYAAVFQSDLAELTRDLAPARGRFGSTPEVSRGTSPARRVTGGTGPSTSLAVMGGCERTGVWTLSADHTAFALMGGVEMDLRAATLQAHETTIHAFAIMGGIEILVPDDIHVEVEGLGLMGGFSEASGRWKPDPRPVRQPPAGAPVVRVTGLAMMGGVEIRRVPRAQ